MSNNEKYVDEIKPQINNEAKKYSMIASVATTVARDRAISGLYGYNVMKRNKNKNIDEDVIKLNELFTEKYCYTIKKYFKQKYNIHELDSNSLYADFGDLIGQLSRLLIVCMELIPVNYIDLADELIFGLNIKTKRVQEIYKKNKKMRLDSYVIRLRNAVMHGNISTIIHSYWVNSEIVFWDKNNDGFHTEIRMNGEQVNQVIDILIRDVCLKYLIENNFLLDEYNAKGYSCFPPDVIDD